MSNWEIEVKYSLLLSLTFKKDNHSCIFLKCSIKCIIIDIIVEIKVQTFFEFSTRKENWYS